MNKVELGRFIQTVLQEEELGVESEIMADAISEGQQLWIDRTMEALEAEGVNVTKELEVEVVQMCCRAFTMSLALSLQMGEYYMDMGLCGSDSENYSHLRNFKNIIEE